MFLFTLYPSSPFRGPGVNRSRRLFARASLRLGEVIRSGFEPETHSLEGCCSIQLSYRTRRCPRQRGKPASAGRGINTIRAPIRTQKACPLRQIRAQNYCFFLNYARKNVFLCVFFTKYCQKAALSPVCGRHLRDD